MVKETDVIKLYVTEAAIAKMENLYMSLTVKDVDDQEGFEQVHDARMVVVKHRTATEKHRKALKADALAYGRRVDAAAKEIFSKLAPIEGHLSEQEKIVTDEKKRIEEEERLALAKKLDDRIEILSEYGRSIPYQELATMEDDEWEENLAALKKSWEIEQAEIAEKEAKRIAEEERLAYIQKDLEAKEAEIKAEQQRVADKLAAKEAEIAAKERKMREEQERIERAEFEKKAAEEARIQAERDAAEKVEREKKEAEDRKAAEEAEKARQEALKPDKEKAIAWLRECVQTPEFPALSDETMQEILGDAQSRFEFVYDQARLLINEI